MLYGSGIPILFPIGLVALSVIYLTDRFSLAYFYRMPPSYGDELNTSCIKGILFYPIFYAGIGFWMYTN